MNRRNPGAGILVEQDNGGLEQRDPIGRALGQVGDAKYLIDLLPRRRDDGELQDLDRRRHGNERHIERPDASSGAQARDGFIHDRNDVLHLVLAESVTAWSCGCSVLPPTIIEKITRSSTRVYSP